MELLTELWSSAVDLVIGSLINGGLVTVALGVTLIIIVLLVAMLKPDHRNKLVFPLICVSFVVGSFIASIGVTMRHEWGSYGLSKQALELVDPSAQVATHLTLTASSCTNNPLTQLFGYYNPHACEVAAKNAQRLLILLDPKKFPEPVQPGIKVRNQIVTKKLSEIFASDDFFRVTEPGKPSPPPVPKQ
jgi:hypothetical protein